MAKSKAVTEREILEASLRFLTCHGFHGFGMRDLASEMGITSATLHYHVVNKDGLAAMTLDAERTRLNDALAALAAEVEDWPQRREEVLRILQGAPLGPALLATAFSLPKKTRTALDLLFSNLNGWLLRFVTEARRRNEAPSALSVEEAAHQVLAQGIGAALLSSSAPSAAAGSPTD